MGIFGKVKSLFTGSPKAPAPTPFKPDPFISSQGFQDRLGGSEEAYYNALMKYMEREPGFDEATLQDIYNIPAEQSKFSEQESLRRLNQGSAYRGVGEGARRAGRGEILTGYGANRAQMQRQTRVEAAKVALADRLSQLNEAARYTNPRMAAGLSHTGMQNQYQMGLNDLAFQKYLQELSQYNQDFSFAWDLLEKGASAAMGMAGGGGGGGFLSGMKGLSGPSSEGIV